PPKENLAAIETALKSGKNSDVTVKEFPKLNHLFQTSTTGGPDEYGNIEETFAPVALDFMGGWIVERFVK
ncbi:MAG: alpha/beta hydrolase, partial [Calditrichaeota bacterium]|nr:alpha/beta hydrolase [Calditrichota bacterium]